MGNENQTRDEPKCSPTLTECPRCKNEILKCDGLFAGVKENRAGVEPKVHYMDSPHYRVNKFAATVRVMRESADSRNREIARVNDITLLLDDLEDVVQRSAPLYTGEENVAITEPDYKALYHELLFAVGTKWEGETRHQTALRYIRQRESYVSEAASARQPKADEGHSQGVES